VSAGAHQGKTERTSPPFPPVQHCCLCVIVFSNRCKSSVQATVASVHGWWRGCSAHGRGGLRKAGSGAGPQLVFVTGPSKVFAEAREEAQAGPRAEARAEAPSSGTADGRERALFDSMSAGRRMESTKFRCGGGAWCHARSWSHFDRGSSPPSKQRFCC
jgi:hypothetical protein